MYPLFATGPGVAEQRGLGLRPEPLSQRTSVFPLPIVTVPESHPSPPVPTIDYRLSGLEGLVGLFPVPVVASRHRLVLKVEGLRFHEVDPTCIGGDGDRRHPVSLTTGVPPGSCARSAHPG